jgi:hypothetical protein
MVALRFGPAPREGAGHDTHTGRRRRARCRQRQGTVNRLDFVALVPGWGYEIKSNGDGSNSRVELDLSNPTTGERASIRVENGKTVIR